MTLASYRKRYQDHIESPAKDGPPIASAPVDLNIPSAVAANAAPADEKSTDDKTPSNDGVANASPAVENDPVREAERNSIKARLQEMEQAEALQREAISVQQRLAAELPQQPQELTFEQQIAHLPERVQRWCRSDRRFLTDPEKISQVQYCHWIARREVGEEFTNPYYDRMDQMLGFAPAGNGQTPGRPIGNKPPVAAPLAPRNVAPARQHAGPPVSAPPTREAPSMTTGRPRSIRMPLTADELYIAQQSGQTPEQYQEQKEKMLRMKADGQLQDGR
jgi:hypothetical protein